MELKGSSTPRLPLGMSLHYRGPPSGTSMRGEHLTSADLVVTEYFHHAPSLTMQVWEQHFMETHEELPELPPYEECAPVLIIAAQSVEWHNPCGISNTTYREADMNWIEQHWLVPDIIPVDFCLFPSANQKEYVFDDDDQSDASSTMVSCHSCITISTMDDLCSTSSAEERLIWPCAQLSGFEGIAPTKQYETDVDEWLRNVLSFVEETQMAGAILGQAPAHATA